MLQGDEGDEQDKVEHNPPSNDDRGFDTISDNDQCDSEYQQEITFNSENTAESLHLQPDLDHFNHVVGNNLKLDDANANNIPSLELLNKMTPESLVPVAVDNLDNSGEVTFNNSRESIPREEENHTKSDEYDEVNGESSIDQSLLKRLESNIIRFKRNESVDNCGNGDQDSYTAEKVRLPKCRMTRTYVCDICNYVTQSPREHLHHARDTHGESFQIYECDRCQYASKNFTKLMRHLQMVHKANVKELEVNGSRKKVKASKFRAPPKNNAEPVASHSKKDSRLSKSPRSIEDPEFFDDDCELNEEEDDMEMISQELAKKDGREEQIYACDQCEYTCKSQKNLNKHELTSHLKKKIYRCSKCNYATNIKAIYTKHMKYHKLPIVKCPECDFRTPYRWNLDRHAKNHAEESEYKCLQCNFSAPIKQSLTVHVTNHHLSPAEIKRRELNRTIGISDPQDYASDDEELEMLKMERDEHPDAFQLAGIPGHSFTVSNIDMGSQDECNMSVDGADSNESGEPKKKKPKIKMTLKKMKSSNFSTTHEHNERHNFDEDFVHPDDLVHRNGHVYIKSFKCERCSYKAAFRSDLIRHSKKVHNYIPVFADIPKKMKKLARSSSSGDVSTASSDQESSKDETGVTQEADLQDFVSPPESVGEVTDEDSSQSMKSPEQKDAKRKSLPPEDLQEKLPTTNAQSLVCQYCGHNSKSLSESVRHQKLHLSAKNMSATPSLSTRCQFCRQRCKSTEDLAVHLKMCKEARKNQLTDGAAKRTAARSDQEEYNSYDDDEDSKESGALEVDTRSTSGQSSDNEQGKNIPEARVFDFSNNAEEEKEMNPDIPREEESPETASSVENSTSSELKGHTYTKRVYRCPSCKFWSTTASRFHVHIVGHFNKKPYVCTDCGYRSNWRWDITKHIKIRASRDNTHKSAEVLITDETGEKNYEKYEKYVTVITLDESMSSRTEGGSTVKKGRPKKSLDNEATFNTNSVAPSAVVAPGVGNNSTPAAAGSTSNSMTSVTKSATTNIKHPMVKIPLVPGGLPSGGNVISLPELSRAAATGTSVLSALQNISGSIPGNAVSSASVLASSDHASLQEKVKSEPDAAANSIEANKKCNQANTQSRSVTGNDGSTFKAPKPRHSIKPPPLLALKGLSRVAAPASIASQLPKQNGHASNVLPILPTSLSGGQYQIITPQVRLLFIF